MITTFNVPIAMPNRKHFGILLTNNVGGELVVGMIFGRLNEEPQTGFAPYRRALV
jgi:hypothetical protein